jgi:extracellular elastinolytic metalloproteinase
MRSIAAKSLLSSVLLTVLVLGPAVLAEPGAKSFGPVGFLTGPQAGEPLALALSYLKQHREELGLTAGDLDEFVVKDHYLTRHNGTTHIYLKQTLDGIEVWNGNLNVNVARDGSIINLGNSFVSDLAGKVNTRSPAIGDREAIARAAGRFGLSVDPESLVLLRDDGGPARRAEFAGTGLSRDDIPVHLVYERLGDGGVRLAWRTVMNLVDSPDWWELRVDAVTGEVISQNNWTSYASYKVIRFPAFENPDDSGGQATVPNPQNLVASPFGWHDTNGVAGAEFTDTRGNNVDAHDDLDANNVPGIRPAGGPNLIFHYDFDPNLQPDEGTNLEAAIVNLFYANNVMHDLTYQYGFDEAAGNFQVNNYGNGGFGNDAVQADAQDGSGTNNANFSTPGDGGAGRMQMFRWLGPLDAFVTVNSPAGIAGDYSASSAGFGPALTLGGVTADVEEVNDGTAPTSDACEPLVGFTPGNIALIDRGVCEFGAKVLAAETAGASAAIVVNDRPGILHMGAGAVGGSVTIPSAMVTQDDGAIIRAELLTKGVSGVNATLRADPDPPPDRDSDFDNGVIAHEYGHGISNRLTGGPANSGCLGGDEQAGEGWSDFWTLTLTAKDTDTRTQHRGIGNYVSFQDETGPGIRNFPYTTDLIANPQTYAGIGSTNIPHGVGEIWMDMVWEVYWELVLKYGFDNDLYNGTGGNNLTIRLVVDGMKLQPCLPDFVEARDAILLADMNDTGGANQCEIWRGFAKRGLGVNADAGALGGGTGVGDETEDFTIPAGCCTESYCIFSDGFESGDISAW